jgi:hypothetical protein
MELFDNYQTDNRTKLYLIINYYNIKFIDYMSVYPAIFPLIPIYYHLHQ